MTGGTILTFRSGGDAQGDAGEQRIAVERLVIAGWTGRDKAAMEHHIAELEAIGVKRPAATPIFYRVAASLLTQAEEIQVSGADSSGEVEYVLVKSGGALYVGVGSDHTDRKIETIGITVSKQLCAKPVASPLWRFAELRDHWDRLVLRSYATIQGKRALYQEGAVAAMLDPEDLLDRYREVEGELLDGSVMFCGTLAAHGGVRFAERFEFELEDPVAGRRIRHGYGVTTLPVRG